MKHTRVKIQEVQIDGEILESNYFSETVNGVLTWTSILFIQLAEPIHLSPDDPTPPFSLLRNGEWITGKLLGNPQPPRYTGLFVMLPKLEQCG